ncbi:hypothetical protein SUGI_1032940 [Cryptomeria japonica]|nr:hypothetical protein SUGI_1032940 [Cryptomeria japonica]
MQGRKPTNLWNVSVINAMALVDTEHEISKHKSFAFDLGLEEADNHYWSMKLEEIMTTCVSGDRFCFVETGNDSQILVAERSIESKYVATTVAQTIKQDDVNSFYTGSTLSVQRAMIITVSELALYAQFKESFLSRHSMMDGLGTHETMSFNIGFAVVEVLNLENVARICMTPVAVLFDKKYVEISGPEYYIGVLTFDDKDQAEPIHEILIQNKFFVVVPRADKV